MGGEANTSSASYGGACIVEAVVVDVGCMTGRGWGVVEANPAWASGMCGCDPAGVLPVLWRATVARNMISEADGRWGASHRMMLFSTTRSRS